VEQQHREMAACLERLQAEFDQRSLWALQLKEELADATRRSAELQSQVDKLKSQLKELEKRLEDVAKSRWIKLGNRLGLGPKLPGIVLS
jgi:hypothetical protein